MTVPETRRIMAAQEAMRLYVGYREYITVEQVSELLSSINEVYDSLFFVEAPIDNVQRRASTKLRVGDAQTGSSIIFELVQGSQQVINAVDPQLRGVAGGAAVLALTGRILINYFRRGSTAWDEHQARKDEHQARELE